MSKIKRISRKASTLSSIEIDDLLKIGIKGIILDLDNTIVSEDDQYLSPGSEDWIVKAKLEGLKFFLLSNGKRHYRVQYWSSRLYIPAINPAKKPFPKAFRQAITKLGLKPQQVVVIGDGLHTDILGAWFSGCSSIQVASLPHPPRWWEKLTGRFLQMSYPTTAELWDFDSVEYEKVLY
ncbi:YqeG family HAD IIIA-type phosphatase [Aetokthonos hydrillicola Thurmond2011]|uniref:YqeG family HAD IIIA-type phosphatase n=1 Tax=Aetokthonos hydrillicola Thurmond2011 TaxID=2712845 RepID=A0AAP5M6Y3_9CYAN|nr:YqeG family HAD IIIA-type phosphatase [Aetokthonos hydrillicola]MDR9893132.1 YqeG family HAD IIIA-type phosphatase [Aetokthonos hydrillicola Thurmond2011]